MPREHDVRAAIHESADRAGSPAHERLAGLRRLLKRVMGDQHAELRGHAGLEAGAGPADRRARDAAALPSVGIDRVQAHDEHLVVLETRLEVAGDGAPMANEGVEEPDGEVVERHVVISRHHETARRQAVEEAAGLRELPGPGPLGQVARDRHKVWRSRVDRLHQRVEQLRPGAAEVQVGEVQDPPHRSGRCGDEPAKRGSARRNPHAVHVGAHNIDPPKVALRPVVLAGIGRWS